MIRYEHQPKASALNQPNTAERIGQARSGQKYTPLAGHHCHHPLVYCRFSSLALWLIDMLPITSTRLTLSLMHPRIRPLGMPARIIIRVITYQGLNT